MWSMSGIKTGALNSKMFPLKKRAFGGTGSGASIYCMDIRVLAASATKDKGQPV